MRLSIARLTILGLWNTTNHGGIGETCLVTWSAVTGCAWSSCQLGISSSMLVAVTLPEWGLAGARGVVVGWGRAVALFFLVVADHQEL